MIQFDPTSGVYICRLRMFFCLSGGWGNWRCRCARRLRRWGERTTAGWSRATVCAVHEVVHSWHVQHRHSVRMQTFISLVNTFIQSYIKLELCSWGFKGCLAPGILVCYASHLQFQELAPLQDHTCLKEKHPVLQFLVFPKSTLAWVCHKLIRNIFAN